MVMARVKTGLVAGCLLVCGGTAAWAAPTASQVLGFKPKQEGVAISTPTAQEEAACKVELVKGAHKGSGWLLRDPAGRPLRRFFDTNDDNRIDVWSYFKNGVEVYREIDTNANARPDQYRWLNAAGMKWAVDENEDGRIDGWKVISPEEVSQEVLAAVARRDFGRLQALMITDAEIKALDLPADQAARIAEARKQAPAKFQATAAKLALSEKAAWLHLETAAPECAPADQTGGRADVYRYRNATVLCDSNGKNEWLQTGELLLVGQAWRVLEAPTPGIAEVLTGGEPGAGSPINDPELKKLLEELNAHDQTSPRGAEVPGPNDEIARYQLKRADLIERIIAKVKPEEREQWIRQVADCLSAAAQSSRASDRSATQRLTRLEEQIVGSMPGSSLAAYVSFRKLSAEYAMALVSIKPADFEKVQEAWVEKLTKFVQTYPKAEDTPDALMQLGMVNEFLAKEVPAKNWYGQLVKNFGEHRQAPKAAGALRRLDSEGKPLELAGQTLDGGSLNLAQLQGKVVIVYYWASWNGQCAGDFAKLKQLQETYGSKGVELVCVNLDTTAEEAASFLRQTPVRAPHVFMPGGLDSPLGTHYGIQVLPHLFLVGKDGKVVSRTVQVGTLEPELKKLTNQ